MKHLAAFALFFACVSAAEQAAAQTIETYRFRKVSASIPVLTQGNDPKDGFPIAIIDRLLTKVIINLARGRALDEAVPKNELLALGLKTDFSTTDPIYLVVIDSDKIDDSKPPFGLAGVILAVVGEMPTFKAVLDKPKGSSVFGFATVSTREVGSPTNKILVNTLQGSAKVKGKSMTTTGLFGDFSFVKDGVQVDGIVAGGTFKSSGADLFLMNIAFPPGL